MNPIGMTWMRMIPLPSRTLLTQILVARLEMTLLILCYSTSRRLTMSLWISFFKPSVLPFTTSSSPIF
jgi:hypothetical protein